ncbi:MAG: methylmalonyl-CoA epimerase [Thermoanaerobaculia bacterium]
MSTKLDHVGIAVASLDGSLEIYRELGLEEDRREEVESQKVRTSFLSAGDVRIELLEPTGGDSPISNFLARRGPGIHHLCFAVDDLDGALSHLAERGYRLLNPVPVPGADGKRVAFLHPAAGGGVLIELTEHAR